MWLLLVVLGSGCLARCWSAGFLAQGSQEGEQDRERKEGDRSSCGCPRNDDEHQNKVPDPLLSCPGQGDGMVETMIKRKEKNAWQQMDPVAVARRLSAKKLFDEEDGRASSSKLVDPVVVSTTTTATTTSSSSPEDTKVTVEKNTTFDQERERSAAMPAMAKRMIEFSKHPIHEGDIAVIDVKRKRGCSDPPQEQGRLSAFTCSFMDNPGLTDLWFGPRDGARIRKTKTPSRTRSKGAGRRGRSVKPVSSLESCLNAQLHFDEDKRVSKSLIFQPFVDGRRGLGEVEALGTGMVYGAAYKNFAHLPALRRPFLRKHLTEAGGDPSQRALLFSFGVGIGVLHMISSSNTEIERLRKCLKESEDQIRTLQRKDHGAEHKERISTAQSDSTTNQLTNMAELEAQLEAELELMQLNSTEELDAEVVHNNLNPSGLPGASDFEEDDKHQSHGEGHATNWAVSPWELDRRLRMLIETRQDERIAQLEEELHHAESQLSDREMELQVWRDRVFRLTEVNVTSSGNNGVGHKSTDMGNTTEEDPNDRGKPGEQSPTDDICDEFLKSVLVGSYGLDAAASSCTVSDCGESWPRQASGTTPEIFPGESSMEKEPEIFQHNRSSSTDAEHEKKATPPWSYSSFVVSQAGSTTPIEDIRSSKLFNTPRTLRVRNGALVLDKIRYWENLARGREKSGANTPTEKENLPEGNTSPLSCSDGSSRDDSSDSDTEEHRGHGLIKRIVEKSRKGSALLKDVEKMIAALDSE